MYYYLKIIIQEYLDSEGKINKRLAEHIFYREKHNMLLKLPQSKHKL